MTSDRTYGTESRVALKPAGSARGHVDGGWWPGSDDLVAEVPALVAQLRDRVGPVSRISYHLDSWPSTARKLRSAGRLIRLEGFSSMPPNTLVVIGSDTRRVTLVLVAHGTPGGVARAVLRSAARPDNEDTAEEILAGNGAGKPTR